MAERPDFPVFAVVGHPNQGKSSVVSTLVQDDHVAISPISGTTREAHQYRLMLADEVLYEMVDTPGFQRARQVLDWCAGHSESAAGRPAVLAEFVARHRREPRFADDCALLEPILRGAGIVYVVDCRQPFSTAFEAELTLLSWSGQPRLALLNPMGDSPHEADWRAALRQYFSLVRTFNPLLAPFEQHLALLQSMAEIHPPWRQGLLHSIEALQRQRQGRHRQAADRLVAYLEEVLRFQLQLPVIGSREQIRATGLDRYNRELQRRENRLQQRLAELYGHSRLDWEGEWPGPRQGDLTDAHEWRAWGLSRTRLASLSGAAGARSGLAVRHRRHVPVAGSAGGGCPGGCRRWLCRARCPEFQADIEGARLRAVAAGAGKQYRVCHRPGGPRPAQLVPGAGA